MPISFLSLDWRLRFLVATLALVELASVAKLTEWLFWTYPVWLAFPTAAAFVFLLLASIVAMGSDIPAGMRRHLWLAGVWLMVVQATASTLTSYEHSFSMLPVWVVERFFSVSPDIALKAMAVLQGATLSIVSLSFWSVAGHLLRQRLQEREAQRTQLHRIEEFLREQEKERVA